MNSVRLKFGKYLRTFLDLFLHDLEVLTSDLSHRSPGKPSSGAPGKPSSGAPDKPSSGAPGSGIFLKAFMGLFLRDLRVLTREFLPFLLRVGMQPLLFLFVFTFIMPRMGGTNPMAGGAGGLDFGTVLLPGLTVAYPVKFVPESSAAALPATVALLIGSFTLPRNRNGPLPPFWLTNSFKLL